ncbi:MULTISPECIES: type IV pilin protein [Mesobacillus]|uniref:Prepilin-type N-terminal cleavage/methylation domain-containing protein n=2 Tax=Mesobacillus TaxID=2675231 RepID=A0A0D6Z9B8_9BACI|nr:MULTISPECIES: prepilin-type N-terminal cleavage/methylation domain-containing protein [Mesobacillus]KIY22379.1 hypothetical protein UB32_08790 [Mesobacillus subterraneus]MDQ0414177.1 type IV pilus assembly protein PilA [Mesobacillus stamsii]
MLENMKKKWKSQRGFTLVELLGVIVILGIISSIAVPSIGGIIEKSKKDAAVADALQIINAAKLANAANVPDPWDETKLGTYLTKSGDPTFTVTIDADGKFSIAGHEAAAAAVGGTDPITEADLINFANPPQ